jgi:hydrogenase/urease accessory protein HupE
LEARDIIAIIVVVGTFIAIALRALSPEQAISILMFILGYYFGYKYGYERGVTYAAGKSGKGSE